MEQNFENDFSVLYENDSTSNYLVLRTCTDKTIINYQAQMLLNNKLNGLLEFNINYIGDVLNCFYNVTSKCTLASFMSRKHFSRDEFLITIHNIINNIYELKNYLLYDNNILLDENFIYVEPEFIDIYFVYLPFLDCKNDIKAFFTKLIFTLVKFNDEYSDNYIQKILEVIKNDNFSLGSLKSLIEKLLGEEIKIEAEKLKVDKVKADKVKAGKVKTDISKADKNNSDKAVITRGNIKIPNTLNIQKQEQKNRNLALETKAAVPERDNESGSQTEKMKPLLLSMLLLQPFLLLAFIIIVNSSFVKSSDNSINTVIILLLIFLAVDVLVIRMINEKIKNIDKTSSCKPLQFITDMMKNKTKPKADALLDYVNDTHQDQQPIINENYKGETVIIKRAKPMEQPYLKEKGGEEVVEINKKSLLVGRMESFVDFVINSSAIGKIHAEILQEGEDFYVIDCNSRNGTYLNDNRIVPNTKNKVSNNDLLRFANREFIFFYAFKPQET